jgi:hypothetical protein
MQIKSTLYASHTHKSVIGQGAGGTYITFPEREFSPHRWRILMKSGDEYLIFHTTLLREHRDIQPAGAHIENYTSLD